MLGLVPSIHALRRWWRVLANDEALAPSISREDVDGRHKGDHDGEGWSRGRLPSVRQTSSS
jgi:hypothetical protein